MKCVGPVLLNSHVLLIAGVAKELVEVTDFASDNLVLRLCSSDTLRKVDKNDIMTLNDDLHFRVR